MQKASIRLLSKKPGTFFGASPGQTFELEITDLVNEVAEDIAKYQDWQALVRTASVTGNGVLTEFDLPADYDRQMQVTDIQQVNSWFWSFTHVTDINDFLFLTNRDFQAYPGAWIIYGDKLRFTPAPPSAPIAQYPYISKNWAVSAGGVSKSAFDTDTDDFALPERLLTLGLVWRWRENKGLEANGDQEAFVKALDEYAAKDGGSKVIRASSRRYWPGARIAWPWALG